MKPPDFDALRAKRNRRVYEQILKMAEEYNVPTTEITSTFDPSECYCACSTNGPCEHKWDGEPWESADGCGWSVTCSRCGCTAMSHDMRVGP